MDRPIEIARCYAVEMNAKKKVMRISRQPSAIQFRINKKQQQNVEYFIYGCSVITKDARWTREIKSGIALAKTTFYKKTLFTRELELNLRNKLLQLDYIFHGAGTGHVGVYIKISGKCSNVVLERHREDQLNRSCVK